LCAAAAACFHGTGVTVEAAAEGILDGMDEPDAWDPGSLRNRDRTRESWRQVRGLLMEWDMIGVADPSICDSPNRSPDSGNEASRYRHT
jgi:hypothetical protein